MPPTAQAPFCPPPPAPPPLPPLPPPLAHQPLLALNPDRQLDFTGPFTHRTHAFLTLSNGSATDRIAYKIKSTATKGRLAVKPARGVVEPKQTIEVEFTIMPVARNTTVCPPAHKILIQSVVIDKKSLDLDAIWQVTMWKRLMVNKLECVYNMPLPVHLQGQADAWGQGQQPNAAGNQQEANWGDDCGQAAAAATNEWGQPAATNEVAIPAAANDAAWGQEPNAWAGYAAPQAPAATAAWGEQDAGQAWGEQDAGQAWGQQDAGQQEAGQAWGTQDQGGWGTNNNYEQQQQQQPDQGWGTAVVQHATQNAHLPLAATGCHAAAGDHARNVAFEVFREFVFSCHVFSLLLCIGIIIGKCWL